MICLADDPYGSSANYFKSLDCRCELASEARMKTGNELPTQIAKNVKIAHWIFAFLFN
jgi:hypothetical protein